MSFQIWTRLNEFADKRRKFDPSKKEDLRQLGYFKKYRKWENGCPFYIEWPFHDAVSMCQAKYTDYMLERLAK
jgi:hypothetical protein